MSNPTLPPTDDSLRERIMQHLEARFKAATAGGVVTLWDGAPATLRTTWNTVTRKPMTALNRMLLDVQHVANIDRTCGGLTLNVEEVRNELSLDGPGDNVVGGMIEFTVTYRHRASSPRLPR